MVVMIILFNEQINCINISMEFSNLETFAETIFLIAFWGYLQVHSNAFGVTICIIYGAHNLKN